MRRRMILLSQSQTQKLTNTQNTKDRLFSWKRQKLTTTQDKDSTCVIGSGDVVRQDEAGDSESRWVYFHFDCPLRMCRVPAPVFLIIFLEKVSLVIFLKKSCSHFLSRHLSRKKVFLIIFQKSTYFPLPLDFFPDPSAEREPPLKELWRRLCQRIITTQSTRGRRPPLI